MFRSPLERMEASASPLQRDPLVLLAVDGLADRIEPLFRAKTSGRIIWLPTTALYVRTNEPSIIEGSSLFSETRYG